VFIGKHDRSLDDKGRLVLPSSYRREFEDAGGGIVAPWDRCLAMWPRDVFEGVMDKLIEKVESGEAKDDVARVFQSQAAEFALDGQGRFVVPVNHRTHAGIERDVQVIGQRNRVELWDVARFAAIEQENAPADVSAEIRNLRIFS
jgi:MraZ protein